MIKVINNTNVAEADLRPTQTSLIELFANFNSIETPLFIGVRQFSHFPIKTSKL